MECALVSKLPEGPQWSYEVTKECGWKDGDRGRLAEWEQTHGKKKATVCLDINRLSHGRT